MTQITDYPNLLLSCMNYVKDDDNYNKTSIKLCIQYFPEWFNRLHVANLTGIPYRVVCELTKKYNIKYKLKVYA